MTRAGVNNSKPFSLVIQINSMFYNGMNLSGGISVQDYVLILHL